MYRSVSLVVLGIAALALAASTPAHALALDEVNVHVPYAFHVLDKTLPGGDYIIEQASPYDLDVLLLWSKDGHYSAMVPVEDASPPARDRYKAQLVFTTYQGARYLRSLQLGDLGDVTVMPTKTELRLGGQKASASSGHRQHVASTAR